MSKSINKLKRQVHRLWDVDVNEISLVDRPANCKKFILFKRDDGGNEMTKEELEKLEADLKKREEDLKKREEDLKKSEEVLIAKDKEIDALKAKIAELDPKKDKDEIAALKAKCSELEGKVSKKKEDLTEDELLTEFTSTMEVMKVGRKVSKKNMELIKNAIDSLSKLMSEIQAEADAENDAALNKEFEALPEEEQKKIVEQLTKLNDTLDQLGSQGGK